MKIGNCSNSLLRNFHTVRLIMRKLCLIISLIFYFGTSGHAACDFKAASNVIIAAKKMGTFDDQSDRLIVKWGPDWAHANRDQKIGLIHSVADADACLMGQARPIFFYYYNKLVGKADPTFGIKLLE